MTLFDWGQTHAQKEAGQELAVKAKGANLAKAREIAQMIAREYGQVNADQVGQELARLGIPTGPWMGSLFKGKEWEFTGQFVRSTRITNHGRLLRVWRLNNK